MIIGHERQRNILKNIANSGNISHAFLFSGQGQLGKKTIAIEFAKTMNCASEDKPCGKCKSCIDIENNRHPDFIFIAPAASGREIEVAKIREAIWKLSLTPYDSEYKIAIINECHLMNAESQNCFLKTLEEPRGKAILILVTEYPDSLLSTISSRAQRIKFFPVSNAKIKAGLIKIGIGEEKSEKIIALSCGKPGKAIFLTDEKQFAEQERMIGDIISIGKFSVAERFKYAKNQLDKADENATEKFDLMLGVWLDYFRAMFFKKAVKDSDIKISEGIFSDYPIEKIGKIIKNIQLTEYLISTTNASPKLALEQLLLEI